MTYGAGWETFLWTCFALGGKTLVKILVKGSEYFHGHSEGRECIFAAEATVLMLGNRSDCCRQGSDGGIALAVSAVGKGFFLHSPYCRFALRTMPLDFPPLSNVDLLPATSD